jgi:hypothetical protein
VCGKKFIQNKLSIEFFPLKIFVGGGGKERITCQSILEIITFQTSFR